MSSSATATFACNTFAASKIGSCYCVEKLNALLSDGSSSAAIVAALKQAAQSTLPQDCGAYISDFLQAR